VRAVRMGLAQSLSRVACCESLFMQRAGNGGVLGHKATPLRAQCLGADRSVRTQ